MKKIFYFIILTTLFFCKKNDEYKYEKIIVNQNKNILDFKIIEGLNEDQISKLPEIDNKFLDSTKLNPKLDTIKYKKGEIYISYLTFTTGCQQYVGNIKYKKDSIFMELIDTTGIACTERYCDRVRFRIKNPENKKYFFFKIP